MFSRICRGVSILAILSFILVFDTSAAQAETLSTTLILVPEAGTPGQSLFAPTCQPVSVAAVAGACGAANGSNSTAAPSASLCNAGTPSFVSGTGPWSWLCSGANGGPDAVCSANLSVAGTCGSSNGGQFAKAPTSSLCNIGSASSISGSGPWSWSCAGINGGASATCSASLAVSGTCGSSNGGQFSQVPGTNLCNAGTASSVSGTGPWSWSCAASGGTATCSAVVTPINGLCGASNGGTFASAPRSNLCYFGTASTVGGTGPWVWTCNGSNGGTKVSCGANISVPAEAPQTTSAPTSTTTAPLAVNGVCGSSNDTIANVLPTANLCATGAASSVTGSGPWFWSCAGSNGGSSASCTVNTVFNPADPTGSGYHLTFDDEFSSISASLPPAADTNWETNFWYRSELASNYDWLPLDPSICDLGLTPYSISDGILSINSQSINPALKGCGAQETYTGGHLDTYHSFSQEYGYFETRAKVSNVYGTEFAFWLLPEDGSWPPEIDALELLGRAPSMPVLTNHTDEGGTNAQYPFYPVVGDLSQDFHTYGVLWTSKVITWYIDNEQVAQTPTRSDENKPFYLILEFGTGACNDGWADCPTSSTSFNDSAQVDWVHAWSSN